MGVEWLEILIYLAVFGLCAVVIIWYILAQKKQSRLTRTKIDKAKEEGSFEPVSLHPHIDLSTCIGSGACVSACPEKDILGFIDGQATVINASSCVGHGACFHACPVEAITLRIGTATRGIDLPHINQTFETNVPGIYIAGELGGMGLIKNSVEQGRQAVQNLVAKRKESVKGIYDLVIIGAGPAGISGALTAKKNGLSCVVLEQYTLGGTVYSFPRSKIVMTHPMDLSLYGKVKLYDTSKDQLLAIWNEAISNHQIQILENTKVNEIIPQGEKGFELLVDNKDSFLAHQVLIAIGRRGSPRKLNIPGEDLPKVYYRLLEPELIKNKNIVVVGGGDSAIESALLLSENNQVILSYRKNQFARLKAKNKEKILAASKEGSINVIYSSNLISIGQDHVIVKMDDEEHAKKYNNDLVYIFAGGELPSKFLKNAGIEVKKRFGYILKKHGS